MIWAIDMRCSNWVELRYEFPTAAQARAWMLSRSGGGFKDPDGENIIWRVRERVGALGRAVSS